MEAHLTLLVFFLEFMTTDSMKEKFSRSAAKGGIFLKWVFQVDSSVAEKLKGSMKKKFDTGPKLSEKFMFTKTTDLVLKEIEAEKV